MGARKADPSALFEVEPSELIEILRLTQGRTIDSPDKLHSFLRDVAALVSKISMLPLIVRTTASNTGNTFSESFTEASTWENLLKIGTWSRDEASGMISGRGIHNYILSSNHYVPPFNIQTRLVFRELHGVDKLDAVNAGIVFGWSTPSNVRRYFNLLLNEERMWLELIGDRGGDAYLDYQHLDHGIPFGLRAEEIYEFTISVASGQLTLTIIGNDWQRWNYAVVLPELPQGRVGLRPWRSRVNCDVFKAVQL